MDKLIFTDFMNNKRILNGYDVAMIGAGETKALESETHEDFIRATKYVMRALDVPEELHDIVLTKYKTLDKPPFNDKTLTYRGLHVFRYVFARYAHNRRSSSKVSIAKVYDDKGVITFEDFLDPMWWNTIREELRLFGHTANTNKQPHNLVHNLSRDNFRGIFHLIEKSSLKYFISQCVRIDTESTVFQNDFNNNTDTKKIKIVGKLSVKPKSEK